MTRLVYVYGIVAGNAESSGIPAGLDDAAVGFEREGDLAAITSALDEEDYAPDEIEARSSDVDWVAARAVAHDRVLTWASDRGPVIPLPMFTSIFSSAEAVRSMLRDRAPGLERVLANVARGREYALRVYRVDAELKAALPALSAEVASLRAAADAASPGQRYLLERKLDERLKEELRTTSQRITGEIRAALSAFALDTVLSPIPRVNADAPGIMVLNAAFLIAPGGLHGFQERLTEIVSRLQPSGFRFDFTGPWPPYHFAPSGADG
jgi:cytidylate kinase